MQPLAIIACAAAGLAVAAVIADPGGVPGFGTPHPADLATTPAPARSLADELEHLKIRAVIAPEQMPAWRAFSAEILKLEAATRAFEARSGAARDGERERAAHAILLGGALSEIARTLTPQQADVVSGAMGALAPGLICRELAGQPIGNG